MRTRKEIDKKTIKSIKINKHNQSQVNKIKIQFKEEENLKKI